MRPIKLFLFLIVFLSTTINPVHAQFNPDRDINEHIQSKYRLPFYGYATILSDQKDKGIDFQIDFGTDKAEVLASRDGIVLKINEDSLDNEGRFVEVTHEDGEISRYTRLKKIKYALKPGDKLVAGDLLGYQGNTGRGNSKAYIHFEISTNETNHLSGINWTDKTAVYSMGTDTYLLKFMQSNDCIDIPRGSDQNGIELKLWETNYGGNQLWFLMKEGDYYQILSKFNGKAISISKNSINGEYQIIQDNVIKSDNQLWSIKKSGSGYTITAKLNGYILNASSVDKLLKLTNSNVENGGCWNIQSMNLYDYKKAYLSPAEMKADVDSYIKTLEENHPNMYGYTPKKIFDLKIALLKESLTEPLVYRDFYSKIIQLNKLVDGHTQIYREGSNTRHLSGYYYNNGIFFPYVVKIENGKIYVKPPMGKEGSMTEILSINTVSSKEILSVLTNVMNYESNTMNNWAIQQSFQLYLFSFLNIQGPWFETETKDTATNKRTTMLAKGLPIQDFAGNFNRYYDRREKFKLTTFEKDSIALIEYNMCPMDPESVQEWSLFIKNSFTEINRLGIKHVFVDITRNGGGGGDEVNRLLYNELNHKAYNWTSMMYKKNSGKLKQDTISVPQCTENITNGYADQVYLIQSGCTYSAAVGISAWFKFSGRGKIIGDETGGTTAAYVYAPHYMLPNSRIEYQVSNTLWTFPFGARIDQGILPDLPVKIDFENHHFKVEDLKDFLVKLKTGEKK